LSNVPANMLQENLVPV